MQFIIAVNDAIFIGINNAYTNGIQGTFTWQKWTKSVALSATTSLLVLGTSALAAWGTTTFMMMNTSEISIPVLERIITCSKIASSLVESWSSAAVVSIQKTIMNEKIDSLEMFLMLITGGLNGWSKGSEFSEMALKAKLSKICGNFRQLMFV